MTLSSEGRVQDSMARGAQGPDPHGHQGILSISQSTVSKVLFPAEYGLVGSGQRYDDCGTFYTVGCLNVDEHEGMNLDGVNMEGKAYIERRKKSCHRSVCPTCWEDWANREVKNAVPRLFAFGIKGRDLKPIHLTVSVSRVDYGLSLRKMREKTIKVLKRVHCLGGMIIYHPKRKDRNVGLRYFSPHFHVLGYGWIVDVRHNYVESGYIVKNLGIRKTIEGTIWYQLSHAGVDANHHTVTWFGLLSYNKLKLKRDLEKEVKECPLCHNRLQKLIWIGEGKCPLPDVEGGIYFDDPANWMAGGSRYG